MGNFDQNLKTGQIGESIISKWLQGKGHSVFPAYQIEHHTGKGPQMFAASGDLVLPDLLAFKAGNVVWIEAKHKTCFSWHRISERWTTGIDKRHYKEYLEVSSATQLPVWLLFYHPSDKPDARDLKYDECPRACPTGLFGRNIKILKKVESHTSDRHGPSGMVYWCVDNLKLLATVNEMTGAPDGI
jgi:hypothetical protein